MPNKINDGLTRSQRYLLNPQKKKKRDNNAKRWRQTDRGKFIRNRNHWIASEVREPLEGWENYWETFKTKTHCELCNVEFDLEKGSTSKRGRCLDHHHHSGYIRNVVCRTCNISPIRMFDSKNDKVLFQLHRLFMLKAEIVPPILTLK